MLHKLLFVAAAAVGFSATVQAQIYGEIKASYFNGVDDFGDEQTFGLAVGYEFNDRHALEVEAQVNGFDSNDPGFEVDADIFTYLLNYHYTVWQEGNWRVRTGAGFGWGEAEFGVTANKRGDDNIFVWQVGAGADYSISDNFKATFDLRLQDFDEPSDAGVTYDVGTPVVISVGLRYGF